MPELPEVETVVRTLEHQLKHTRIMDCQVLWDKIIAYPKKEDFCQLIRGKRLCSYSRHGKYLLFDLGTHMWITHLRMEGKFYVQQKEEPFDKHTHVLFTLEDGRELRYHDTRKFGRMYLYEKREDESYPCLQNTGLDAFDERLDAAYLYQKLHHRKQGLKAALLDQSIVAGIGNIYADEICFAMKLHPETRTYRLRKKDAQELLYQIRRILSGAIRAGGTTIRSYTSSLGVDGRFQLKLKVHGKKGEKCPACQQEIKKIVVVGRGTYYCPACQRKR